jgi:hypothetical protein
MRRNVYLAFHLCDARHRSGQPNFAETRMSQSPSSGAQLGHEARQFTSDFTKETPGLISGQVLNVKPEAHVAQVGRSPTSACLGRVCPLAKNARLCIQKLRTEAQSIANLACPNSESGLILSSLVRHVDMIMHDQYCNV